MMFERITRRRPALIVGRGPLAGVGVGAACIASSGFSHAVIRPVWTGASFCPAEKGARSGFVAPNTTAAGMLRRLAAVVMVGLPYLAESTRIHGPATSRNPSMPATVATA